MTNLCTASITTAQTAAIQTAVAGFGTPTSLSVQCKFAYVASAATSVDAYVQTTIDGVNWFDIANFHLTTASAFVAHNIPGATALTNQALTDGTLANNTTVAGLLGAQYRVKITSVGTYGAGTTVAIDVFARY
jgi:hypothetical protein